MDILSTSVSSKPGSREGLQQQEGHLTLKWNSLTFEEDVEGSAD